MMKTTRRNFLKASGVMFALPMFESLGATQAELNPVRMVCVNNNLGLISENYVPEGSGFDYKPSRYLKFLQKHRKKFTSFSGVYHPEMTGGHPPEKSFLTCAPNPQSGSFKNTISLDQLAVDHIGAKTRYSALVLSSNGGPSLSWTRAGVPIPGEDSPKKLYQKLFVNGTKEEVRRQLLRLKMGKSIMDNVHGEAKALEKQMTSSDKEKFDEYLTSVREVEQQMVRMQDWEKRPKPTVDYKQPTDISGKADVIGKAKLMFDLIHLALKTDSTRLVTMNMQGHFIVPPIPGVAEGYHTLSHHGMKENKLNEMALIEDEQMKVLAQFLDKMDTVKEGGKTLLDNTMVMYGSNMGNSSTHDNRNLPLILAGGNFKHGQHLAFDPLKNEHIGNLYVQMLNGLGIESERFGTSTVGYMKGFEAKKA
ncbi:MAG: DUF1552 domain-containing protein [Lentisphaeraceae bacterium]|nr:DUF1552 domain-containing protein [Lentisphaeraceae bacterium]